MIVAWSHLSKRVAKLVPELSAHRLGWSGFQPISINTAIVADMGPLTRLHRLLAGVLHNVSRTCRKPS